MRNIKSCFVAGALLIALPASAQSTKDKLLAVEAGLNDSSSIIRLSTLEEALADGSKAVREYAMNQAFASSDATMRSLAVNHFFRTRKSFAVRIDKSPELVAEESARESSGESLKESRDARYSYLLLSTYGPAANYLISSYDEASGTIQGLCLTGSSRPDERYTFVGSVTGDSVTFQHSCNVSGFVDKCSVELELADDAPEFVGTMQCDDAQYAAIAKIKLN